MEHQPIFDADNNPSSDAAHSSALHSASAPARVKLTVEAPPGACLEVEVEARTPEGRVIGRHVFTLKDGEQAQAVLPDLAFPAVSGGRAARLAWFWTRVRKLADSWAAVLVWSALAIYAVTRLVALDAFPIYFFTDEAVQTVLASDFLRDHLHNYDHEFMPAFFENGAQYNLGLSVYLQVLPYLLLGKSIWITRGAAALTTLAAAFALAGIAKRALNLRFPWLAVLMLSITPAWFLHSRTAFETSLAVTCYAVFLYFYIEYRCRDPRYLYGAIVMAGLTFYSYASARLVIAVTALLLVVIDARYHWQQRKMLPLALGLVVLMALPFLRFLVNHPLETTWQMRLLGSYWISNDYSLMEKIGIYAGKYLKGLDPLYWYLPHDQDLPRHTMLGYGHLGKTMFPLGLLGVGLAVARFRQPAYRVLLVAVLAAPSGAAMVDLGITRALTMVIPMALLTAAAVSWLVEWLLARYRNLSPVVVGVPLFLLLAVWNFWMLGDALKNGPTWYNDYGLSGMQYGARQLFGEVKEYIQANPGVKLIVSPSWANGTDVIARFFFGDVPPFQMGNADGYYTEIKELDDQTVFVLTKEEYEAIPRNKFEEVKVEKVLSLPDSRPGFYFLRLRYAPNIQEIMAAEVAARLKPVEGSILLDGLDVQVTYSRLDMATLAEVFDGKEGTLVRTDKINPFQLHLTFPDPRRVQQVRVMVGGVPTRVTVRAWEDQVAQPITISQDLEQEPNPRYAVLDFGRELRATEMQIEVLSVMDGPEAHVHVWEVILK